MHDYQNARGGATGTELLAHYIQRFRGSLTTIHSRVPHSQGPAQTSARRALDSTTRRAFFSFPARLFWNYLIKDLIFCSQIAIGVFFLQCFPNRRVFCLEVWGFVLRWRTSAMRVRLVSWNCLSCAWGFMRSSSAGLAREDAAPMWTTAINWQSSQPLPSHCEASAAPRLTD